MLILLTDVSGVYDRPPSDPHAELIDVFDRGTTNFKIGMYLYYSIYEHSIAYTHYICTLLVNVKLICDMLYLYLHRREEFAG